MRRVTADSHALISALRFGGKPAQVLELAMDGQIELAMSPAIMAETLRVLRDKFHRNSEQLQEVETFLSAIAKHVYPTERVDAVPTDRDDNRVLECALKAASDTIVSGDSDLLQLGEFRGIRILKAAQFPGEFQTRNG